MKKVLKELKLKSQRTKDERDAAAAADFIVSILALRPTTFEATNIIHGEIAAKFNSFHKHFGNWENLLAKVPEGSRSSLKNWGEAIKEGFLEDFSPSSRQSDLVIKRFVGGEDYMAPFERLKELVNPKERR